MTLPISELQKLDGYRFSLHNYVINHSTLTLQASNPDTQSSKLYLYFTDVHYIQMPTNWKSPFELGSNSEREEVAIKTGLPLKGLSSGVYLYKSKDGNVIILGALMGIEKSE